MITNELTVNGLAVDTANTNITLDFQHFEPDNISLRGTAFTYRFKLPTTKRNNLVFSNRQDWSVIGKFNQTYTGRWYVNSDLLIEGRLIIDSISEEGGYVCRIQSNDWLIPLKGKKLRDLKNYYAPFTAANFTSEEADIQAYIDRIRPSDKIAFPLISYGTFYNQYKRTFWLLDGNGNRTGKLPDGDYQLQNGTCFTILNAIQVDTDSIKIEDGFEKIWDSPMVGALPPYQIEVEVKKFYDDNTADVRVLDLEIEDYTPSFYYLEIIKKIFADAGVNVAGRVFEDSKYTNLVLAYTGSEEFQWNWKRLANFKGWNNVGRSEIDSRVDLLFLGSPLPFSYNLISNYPFLGAFPYTEAALPDGYYDAKGTNMFFDSTNAVTPVKQTYILNYDNYNNNWSGNIKNKYSVQAYGEFQHSQFVTPTTGVYSGKAEVNLNFYPHPSNPTNVSLRPDNFITPTSSVRNKVMLGIFRTQGLADFATLDDNYLNIGWDGFTSDKVLASVELTDGATNIATGGSYSLEFNDITLNENDRIFVAITMLHPANIAIEPFWELMGLQATYSEFEIIPTGFDWDIDIAKNLPDSGQAEFVNDFMFLLNQYYEYNPNTNTITFDNMFNYLDPLIYPPIDLDRYSSNLNATAVRPNIYEKIDIGYTLDNNDYLINTKNYKTYNYNEDTINPEDTYLHTVNLAPTLNRPFTFSLIDNNSKVLSLPSISNEENYFKLSEDVNWSYSYIPRLLLYTGKNVLNCLVSYNTSTVNANYNLVVVGTSYFPNYLNFNAIYSSLYNSILSTSKQSHIVDVKCILNQTTYKELSKHIRLVDWNNDTYIIMNCRYNPLTEEATLKLYKYV